MYTYVGFLWFEQNVAVRDDDAAQRIVIPPKDELVDQSGQGAERLVCIHGHPTELLRFKLRGTFSPKKVELQPWQVHLQYFRLAVECNIYMGRMF